MKTILASQGRIHLGFTMLTTMCLEFSMLNIYSPYGCRLKVEPLYNEPLVLFAWEMSVTLLCLRHLVCFCIASVKLLQPPSCSQETNR
jgi:hypothetical protein